MHKLLALGLVRVLHLIEELSHALKLTLETALLVEELHWWLEFLTANALKLTACHGTLFLRDLEVDLERSYLLRVLITNLKG